MDLASSPTPQLTLSPLSLNMIFLFSEMLTTSLCSDTTFILSHCPAPWIPVRFLLLLVFPGLPLPTASGPVNTLVSLITEPTEFHSKHICHFRSQSCKLKRPAREGHTESLAGQWSRTDGLEQRLLEVLRWGEVPSCPTLHVFISNCGVY